MSKFLVTGGCGFIGSHLCEALLAQGHEVQVLDDLSTGSLANLAHGAALRVGSVEDPDEVARAMAGMDGCFHLAAIASVPRCTEAWAASHRVNLSGTIQVLESARRAGWGSPVPVVYASSAAVYGSSGAAPLEEDADTRPISAYGADKLGCELHARVAGRIHGVPTLGLRFFNVFGPRQDPSSPYSGVISIFCDRIAAGRSVTVHGDGGQTRDFIFVGDVVAALIRGMRLASTEAPVLNVCTGRATSVLRLASLIAETCEVVPSITYAPPRGGDIRHSLGSPRRAGEAGLPPAAPVEAGLAELVRWLRQTAPAPIGAIASRAPAPLGRGL